MSIFSLVSNSKSPWPVFVRCQDSKEMLSGEYADWEFEYFSANSVAVVRRYFRSTNNGGDVASEAIEEQLEKLSWPLVDDSTDMIFGVVSESEDSNLPKLLSGFKYEDFVNEYWTGGILYISLDPKQAIAEYLTISPGENVSDEAVEKKLASLGWAHSAKAQSA